MAKTASLNVSIGAETKRLRRELARANGSLMKFKKTVMSAAGSMGLIFGGATILRGIGASMKKIANFEEQMNKVSAVTGATAKQIKALEKNALKLGASTRFTATEIAQMQESMGRLGKTSDEIVKTTDSVSKLSIATATELAPAAELMVKTMNAFGLSTTESAKAANTLAEATANSALNMEDLSIGLSFAGTAGHSFGWSLNRVTAALGILQDNGLQASKAGTGLRKIFIELAKSGMTFDEAMEIINNSTNKLKTSTELFGITAANQGEILAKNTEKLDKFTERLGDSRQEMEEMSKKMQEGLNEDLRLLSSAWDGLIQKGKPLNNAGRGFVQWLTDAVNTAGGNNPINERIDLLNEALKELGETMSSPQMADFRRGAGEGLKIGDDVLRRYHELMEMRGWELEYDKQISEERAKQKKLAEEQAKIAAEELARKEMVAPTVEMILDDSLQDSLSAGERMWNIFARLWPELQKVNEELQNMKGSFEDTNMAAVDFGSTIQSAVASGITDMATAMGEGIHNVQDFGALLLRTVGGFLQELGAAFIAAGTATLAVKETLFTNPYTAIIGGALLVGIGAALKSSVETSSANLGSGMGGGSGAGGGAGFGGTSTGIVGLTNDEPIKLEGDFVIRGNDLVAVIDKQNYTNSRTGGRTIGG